MVTASDTATDLSKSPSEKLSLSVEIHVTASSSMESCENVLAYTAFATALAAAVDVFRPAQRPRLASALER